MKKGKSFGALALVLILTGALLTACSNKSDKDDANQKNTQTTTDKSDNKGLEEIVVGASIEPHATILNSDAVKDSLKADGFKIKVVEYTDYIQPNTSTEDGSLDANYFQHTPYLNDFNQKNGTHLKSVASIHFEPLGIYPGKTASIADLKDGAQIAVPNDTTNEARALLLLQDAGLIKLKDGVGLDATINDIKENKKNLKIVEVEAAQTVKVIKDVDLSVVNGNYALAEGLSASKDGLLVEDATSEGAKTYANILVVKEGNEDSAKTKALIKALTSDATKKFIEEKYQGAVVPVF
ncbi:MetQ/NlpA family ABC transporter substrate-binding protein [Anaeromicropila herbilytica]|uniref:Lipoprotein n=1 Tax=Anaeromicropila herbilytica TaxID=2785025 RepID=A0A7R7EN44_9FIRM|nr:MetQ/NlpA family ABC transporter substrate-binding protein [Anaeromicropila herbilytica]BCN31577.1 lipoprotein [Anaeromicropila herbilytica]